MNFISKAKNRLDKMSPVAKASAALVFARFFHKGLGMITTPIFTRLMPKSEFGIISTFTAWQSVLYIIATLNMSSGVFNNGMIDYKDDRDGFTFSLLSLANLTTILFAIIYFAFYRWTQPLVDMPIQLMILMILYFVFNPAYNYWSGRQRFDYKYRTLTILIIVSSIVSTGLAILLVVTVPEDIKASAKLLASESVTIALGLFFYIYWAVKAKCKINFKYWKYAIPFSLPLVPHYLSMYILSSSDRIMITRLVGSSETAIYNVAYTVASIMLIFWNALDSAYTPWIYERLSENNYKPINKRGTQVLLFFAGITILVSLFAPEIIRILAPKSYYSGVYAVPAVAASVFFTACFSLFMRIELFHKKTKPITIATCCAALANVILNYIFIQMFGFIAAAYTTLVCYILLSVFHAINVKRIGYGEVYNFKSILGISIGVIGLSFGVEFIYRFTIIRYVLIAVIIIIALVKKDFIISLLKVKKH